ncbi:hypothetical protein D3C81_2043340 [compost metagenome]
MKKVNGMLTIAVITARYGPNASGMTDSRLLDMASTMPVPDRMPVKMPAAKISPVTASTLPAWAAMRSFCCCRHG